MLVCVVVPWLYGCGFGSPLHFPTILYVVFTRESNHFTQNSRFYNFFYRSVTRPYQNRYISHLSLCLKHSHPTLRFPPVFFLSF